MTLDLRHTSPALFMLVNVVSSSNGEEIGQDGAKRTLFPRLNNLPFAVGIFLSAVTYIVGVTVCVVLYTGFVAAGIAIAMLSMTAASAIGGLIGFLFGVPRAPTSSGDRREVADHTVEPEPRPRRRNAFRPNTNLEQVSDWLTKIIVGVGLLQFRQIGTAIGNIGRVVGTAIGDVAGVPGSGTVFAISLMVATSVVTFILAYMWTTTILYKVYMTHVSDDA